VDSKLDLSRFATILLQRNTHVASYHTTFSDSWDSFKRTTHPTAVATHTEHQSDFAGVMQARRKKYRTLCLSLLAVLDLLSGSSDDDTRRYIQEVISLNSRLPRLELAVAPEEAAAQDVDGQELDVKQRAILLLQTQRNLAIQNMTKLKEALTKDGVDIASIKLGEANIKMSEKEIKKYEARLTKLGEPVATQDEEDGNHHKT